MIHKRQEEHMWMAHNTNYFNVKTSFFYLFIKKASVTERHISGS